MERKSVRLLSRSCSRCAQSFCFRSQRSCDRPALLTDPGGVYSRRPGEERPHVLLSFLRRIAATRVAFRIVHGGSFILSVARGSTGVAFRVVAIAAVRSIGSSAWRPPDN